MLQVPDLHISSESNAKGSALVEILSRKDRDHAGTFTLKLDVAFQPNQYPILNNLDMEIDLSDSVRCVVAAKTIEQMSSVGKHTPSIYLTGRCVIDPMGEKGEYNACRYWLLIANNKSEREKGTPDIISLLIYDCDGSRIAHGTGPVVKGDLSVRPGTN
ncbi:MAG: hypothetical protein PVG61_03905 [Dehalococcoidia bacterium]|jgi:hypothetical protein